MERKRNEISIAEPKRKVQKVESENDDSNLKLYDKFYGKSLHVNVDKKLAVVLRKIQL